MDGRDGQNVRVVGVSVQGKVYVREPRAFSWPFVEEEGMEAVAPALRTFGTRREARAAGHHRDSYLPRRASHTCINQCYPARPSSP